MGLRVGVAPRTEARIKYTTLWQVDLGINVRAVDGQRVDLLLMPGYTSGKLGDIDYYDQYKAFALSVIVGIALDEAEQYQLFVGPEARLGKRSLSYRDGEALWSMVGLHVGAAIGGPRDYGTFVPECAWLVTVTRGEPAAEKLQHGRSIVQCSLGVTFGMRHTADAN